MHLKKLALTGQRLLECKAGGRQDYIFIIFLSHTVHSITNDEGKK